MDTKDIMHVLRDVDVINGIVEGVTRADEYISPGKVTIRHRYKEHVLHICIEPVDYNSIIRWNDDGRPCKITDICSTITCSKEVDEIVEKRILKKGAAEKTDDPVWEQWS